jgi:hypothetical protein
MGDLRANVAGQRRQPAKSRGARRRRGRGGCFIFFCFFWQQQFFSLLTDTPLFLIL